MKIQDVNNMSSEDFIENFKNIFEKTSSIALFSEKKRPYKDKKHLIKVFIDEFESLSISKKKIIINNHPDLGNKLKIINTLDTCTEEEFLLFKRMNDEYKLKFSIPFIFAVKGTNKSIIIDEFKRRLKNENIELELEESLKQVKKIANFRLDEIIDE